MNLFMASLLSMLLVLSACNSPQSKRQLNFVLDSKDHDFALETTTGTLCKTWQWEHAPKEPIDDIPVCFMMGHYGK
jgi:hypothetical protein